MEPQYVVLELLGHRQRAGWLSEEEIAGAGFLRLDIPQEGDPPMRTEWYATAAVYAIHPSTEEKVRALNGPRRPLMLPAGYVIEDPKEEAFWESDNEEAEAAEDAAMDRLETYIQEHGGVHDEGLTSG